MVDWDEARIQAAISAMQGVLESGKVGELLEIAPNIVAKQSVRLANCLIEELRKNKSNITLEKEIKEDLEKFFNKNK